MAVVEKKPHLVCVPYPFQSHIGAMMKLAKLLHHKGFYITFVNTEYNHKRLLDARGPDSMDGLSDFKFETIPDGLPPDSDGKSRDIDSISISLRNNTQAPFSSLLNKLNDDVNVPAVTCIVADWLMTFTIDSVATQLGIPVILFWTVSACCFMGFYQSHILLQKGFIPLKDGSSDVDTVLDWIPGKKEIRLKDLPSFVHDSNPNNITFKYCMDTAKWAPKASSHIVHTFSALEHDLLDSLHSVFPSVYAIAPLQLLLDRIPNEEQEAIGHNLWKEELTCLQWLDSKEPNSVIYVNFGSIAVITKEKLIEIGWGLANSQRNFLWVIRPDSVTGGPAILPPEFERETNGRGLIARWCPQERVLNHPSVGGFVTHCGWNSALESLSSGVPMICLPSFGDQLTNCKQICSEWEVGIEMDSDVKRETVEKLVREMIGGDDGLKMKKRALEWRKLIEEATDGPDGSSVSDFDRLVEKLMSFER